jgi:hypothetical protein
MVKSPISLPNSLSIGVSTMRPSFGMVLVIRCDSQASAPWPETSVFGEVGDLGDADALAHGADFVADVFEIVGAVEGEGVVGFFGAWREPERRFQPPAVAHDRVVVAHHDVVERGGLLRAGGGQFLVGEADREAAGIVLAHLGVGVAQRRPFAEAGYIHAPDVSAGIAVHHPVRQRQANAAALAEPGHDGAGGPVVGQAPDRPDQRVAVRREGEGAVDDLLDAGVFHRREMAEPDFQRRRDAVEIGRQQLMAEIPRGVDRRPGLAGLLVGAEQDAGALLAGVDLALEIDDANQFAAGLRVELQHLGHFLGQEIHVLHGENRQFETDHAAHFARPEAAGIDDVVGLDRALLGDDVPGAVGLLGELDNRFLSTISAPSFFAALA